MSTDLKSQIHAYGAQLVDGQRPITDTDIAELLGKVRELPPTPVPVRPKPRPWVAVAAGIAVLVLFGGLSLLLATSGSETPPATTPSTVTSVTSPATTTSLPAEDSGSAVSGTTYQELPNQATIGWEWYETGLERLDFVWRLRDGTYIAYNRGFDIPWDQEDGSVLFSIDGSSDRFVDPIESIHASTDGTSWVEVPLDRFDGFGTNSHADSRGESAPYLYVSARPLGADDQDSDSWSTWATDDGETWFEVLVDGRSAGTHFNGYVQLREQAVASNQSASGGMLVSSDGGRSFATVEPFVSGLPGNDRLVTEVFAYEGAFRALVWTEKMLDADREVWLENPVLWESLDGTEWVVVGTASGLDPRPDGLALRRNDVFVNPLSDGSLVLSGAEMRRASFDVQAAYFLESIDGGLNWAPFDNVPTTGDPDHVDHDSLISAAFPVTTLDGWVVLSTEDVTLATDGNTWIRVDIPSGDVDGVDSFGNRLTPIGLRGVVMSGLNMEWILLPNR